MDGAQLTRRGFVAGAAGLWLASSPGASSAAKRAARRRVVRGGAFGHGVAAGVPGTRKITLWSRVSELEGSGRVRLEVARDPGFSRVVERRLVTASAEKDHTARAVVEGLQPGREYFYRFATRTASSPVGRFRTLAGDSADPVRIGFFSCQDYQAGYYTAHAGLAAEQDLDLIVCLGDYIYERSYYEGPRKDTTGANGDADVQSLAEYRQKYALYRSDPLLQAMHASAPFVAVWDDHEIEDNWAGENPGHATPEDQRRSDFLTRRTAGRRAFFEWMPRLRRREEVDRIYGGVPLGANAELILLDTRSYRDAQPCGDQLIVPCPDAETGARKLLGDAQKQWFVDRVAGSTARWKVVGNQIMVMSLDSAPSVTLNVDAWDGYGAERAEVLQALAGRGVQDLTFITGDIHTFFAGTVHQNGRVATPAIGTEFVGGSITSHGLEDYFAGPLANAGEQGVRANNPHVHFSNFRARGYGVLEARPDELRVTFRSPSTVMEPTAPVSDLAAFRVAAGSTVVETA